jgi:hypothetical protein
MGEILLLGVIAILAASIWLDLPANVAIAGLISLVGISWGTAFALRIIR